MKNAPGAIMNSVAGLYISGVTRMPNHVPAPTISRTEPIRNSAAVKPSPIAIPSTREGKTLFFDANASTAYAAALQNGALTLIPGFTHGQIEGSTIPELTRFAEEQVGRGQRNIRIESLAAEGDGARLRFSLPADVTRADICVYYKTEDLIYDEKFLRELWSCRRTLVSGDGAAVPIPPEARLFYFSVEGRTDENPDVILHATTGVYSRETWRGAEQ